MRRPSTVQETTVSLTTAVHMLIKAPCLYAVELNSYNVCLC